ncbi:MAG: T9SS C-terminal target domain-containing protein [Calditrichaeota bacterium]|nr:phosphodiester glycosidase family protein [Calditrichota bacterium]RQW07269.1 MAG: T9SS C-terminal target domain-containing protein [Calditrichota bacterium]
MDRKFAWLLILLFEFVFLIFGWSQGITWTDRTSTVSLPQGVSFYKGERNNPLLKAWYIDIDLNNANIAVRPYISSSKKGIVQFTQSVGAFAAINGGYFDINSSTSYSAVVYPEEVKAQNLAAILRDGLTYYVTRGFFGITYQREPAVDWIFHFGNEVSQLYRFPQPLPNIQGNPAPYPDSSDGDPYSGLMVGIGGGPVLVKDSLVNISYEEEIFFGNSGVGLSNQDPRSAVGATPDNHVLFLVADGRDVTWSNGVSLIELADIMLSLGCVDAMNLDGGGSTQMAIGNSLINRPEGGTFQRPIPTILALVDADSIPLPPAIYYQEIIDTDDPGCTLQGSGWFPTANPGYWGTSPALLNQIGTGADFAEFGPNLPDSAEYELFAWWVSSSNRCGDTPFIVTHAAGSDTVRVDQRDNGSKWFLLGTYTFRGDTSDKVILSDAGTISSLVVADAIRIVSYDSTLVTKIAAEPISAPSDFILQQNHPNPFNPSTKIRFFLNEPGRINLAIYNILGEKKGSLIQNQYFSAGWHDMEFQAGTLPSGIYIYRLETPSGNLQKKMVLLR